MGKQGDPLRDHHISLGPPDNALHTRAAVDITRSPNASAALIEGIKALALTGIDFLTNPELTASAKQGLEEYKRNAYQHPYPR
ncbi:MAG: hypothetical protein ACLFVP_05285 [Candidatus Bathyarchaeia archaeon]